MSDVLLLFIYTHPLKIYEYVQNIKLFIHGTKTKLILVSFSWT